MKVSEEFEMFFSGIANIIYGIIYLGSAFMIVAPVLWLYDDYKLAGEIPRGKLAVLLIEIPAMVIFIVINRVLKNKREKNKARLN